MCAKGGDRGDEMGNVTICADEKDGRHEANSTSIEAWIGDKELYRNLEKRADIKES